MLFAWQPGSGRPSRPTGHGASRPGMPCKQAHRKQQYDNARYHNIEPEHTSIMPAAITHFASRRYASVVIATAHFCLSVCLSVRYNYRVLCTRITNQT